MSGLTWLILDAFLAIAALAGTYRLSTSSTPKALPASKLELPEEKNATGKAAKDTPKSLGVPIAETNPNALPATASLDDLWRKTLFLPGRAEAEPGDAEAEAIAAAAALAGQNFEFELVGIAQISPAGTNPVPVALLRSKQASQRNSARQNAPGRRGRNEDRSARGAARAAAGSPKTPEKLIFREGDPINATGYLLKAIHPEQKMVEVSRGGETLKLYINYAGADASQRREAVTAAAAKKKQDAAQADQKRQESIREHQAQQEQQRQKNQEARQNENPGTPPPPPGMEGTSPSSTSAEDASSQRLRKQVQEQAQRNNRTPGSFRQRSRSNSANDASSTSGDGAGR